ncbi:sulfur deprivation response regulator, partial [mine drainage metagenome]
MQLTPEMILVLGLVVFTVLMLALEWVRSDITAILVLVVIGVTGLIPTQQVFEGFANSGVQAILAVMIMGVGLDRTGALNAVATVILKAAQGAQWRLLLVINSVTTALSSIIPSQALAALMIPVTSRVSTRSKVPLSKLLLPMACVILT